MLGTIVNVGAIVTGGLLGVFFGRAFPERFKDVLVQGMALAVLLIGIQMAIKTEHVLIVIFSLVFGTLIGESINIEGGLATLGNFVGKKLATISNSGTFSEGFVTASLVYCVGAMAVVGSLEGGLMNNHEIMFAKSILDGVTAIVFASTMGIGVACSGISVLLYQGTIVIAAGFLQEILSPMVITEMSAVGGLLIVGIGLNLLEIAKIRVGNMLPAIFVAIPLLSLADKLPG